MAKDEVEVIEVDSDQKLREIFFEEGFDDTMSFEEFKQQGRGTRRNRKKGSPKSGEKKGFPDLTGDGKVTRKDVLKGRGVKGFSGGGEALMDATSNRATNGNISRGGGAALRGIKFKGVR